MIAGTICILAILCAGEPGATAPVRTGPPMGYLTHPQFGGMDAMAADPITAELANVFVWRTVNPAPAMLDEIVVEFGPAAEWLRGVYASGHVAYPILDTSMHHSNSPWREAMTRAVGENLVDVDGEIKGFSSLHSPLFRKTTLAYTDQLIDWVKTNDPEKRIAGYVDGAEWFYPGMLDYSPLAFNAFREWLKVKYTGLEQVNAAWGAGFTGWEAVEPPRLWGVGHFDGGMRNFGIGRPVRATWTSPRKPVVAGHTYQMTSLINASAPEWMASLELQWVNAKGERIGTPAVFPFDSTDAIDGRMSGKTVCPTGAESMEIVFALESPGVASLRDLNISDMTKTRSKDNAGSNTVFSYDTDEEWKDWTFWAYDNWGVGKRDPREGTDSLFLTIEAPAIPLPYTNTPMAVEDWITFCYESMAEWLNTCAAHFKERDPSRPVTSYLGFIFATHSSWDYAMTMQRADISLANSPTVDINAVQVCAAGADLTYPACPVDMARKYNKPVWSYDLVDFPYGLYSGFDNIYRASMSSIQHGSKGILYCQWVGPPYSYQYSTCLAAVDRKRMLEDSVKAVNALEGYTFKTNVAMLIPLQSFSLADEEGYKSDMLDNGGLYHLVLDMGFTPDLFTPYEIGKRGVDVFAPYDVLFLPDCPIIPAVVQDALLAFAAKGGRVISSGRLPVKDLLGVALPALPDGAVTKLSGRAGRQYWGDPKRLREDGNTPPVYLAVDVTDNTMIYRYSLRENLWASLDEAGVKFPARLLNPDGDIHMAIHERPGERLLFLVHSGPGRVTNNAVGLKLGEGLRPVDALVDLDTRQELTLQLDGQLRLPDFTHTCIVRLAG